MLKTITATAFILAATLGSASAQNPATPAPTKAATMQAKPKTMTAAEKEAKLADIEALVMKAVRANTESAANMNRTSETGVSVIVASKIAPGDLFRWNGTVSDLLAQLRPGCTLVRNPADRRECGALIATYESTKSNLETICRLKGMTCQ